LIQNIQSDSSLPALTVDSGNLLFKRQGSNPKTTPELLTAETILKSYQIMSYDAVAVSGSDLTAGEEFWRSSLSSNFPWISANVFDTSGRLFFEPYRIKQIGELTIGIIGLTGTSRDKNDRFVIRDWIKPLQLHLSDLVKKTDFIILLSNFPFSENIKIGQTSPEIDLIITADKNRGNLTPVVSGNALITQTHGRGKYLGVLSIGYLPGRKWAVDRNEYNRSIENRINSIRKQINRIKKKKSSIDQEYLSAQLEKLFSHKKELEQQLQDQNTDFAERKNLPGVQNSSQIDFVAIRPEGEKSYEISLLIDELKKRINAFNRQGLKKRRQTENGRNLNESYVGYDVCRACHFQQTQFWKSTRHAEGYKTLIKRDEESNIDCLPCHVTTDIAATSSETERTPLLSLPYQMNSIGCEVCHGPGRAHIESPQTNRPINRPTSADCIRCHTPERDNGFDYLKKIRSVTCPKTKKD